MDARKSRYHEVYTRWQRDPERFWGEAAQEIDWIEPAKRVFDPDAGIYGRWFVGGVCNTCWNAVDRHVMQGRGEQPAIIYDSPLAGQKRTLTYRALQVETQVLAAILRKLGVDEGRPCGALYADGAGGSDRHARLCAHWRGALGGVWRLRGERARDPHRRRQAEGNPVGELRARARPHRQVQAAARRGDPALDAQARRLPHPAAPTGGSGNGCWPRPRLGQGA